MDRPEVYSKYQGLQRRDNEYTLDNYLKLIRWKKYPKILDIGCGDGTTTFEVLEPRLPKDYVELVCTDLKKEMTDYAKESNKNSKIDFIPFDMAAEKVPPGQYDHAFSFFTFHWITNLRKAFKNLYDMLTPGGDILINLVPKASYYDLLKRQCELPKWAPYFSSEMIPPIQNNKEPAKMLKTHLTENGFKNVRIYTLERDFPYQSWVHLLKSFLALDPIYPQLDLNLKEEYIVDFFFTLRDVFSPYEETSGLIRMPYTLVVINASKLE